MVTASKGTNTAGAAISSAPPAAARIPAITDEYDSDDDDSYDGSSSEDEGPERPEQEGESSNIYLGLPDGPLEGEDEANPLVSRLGGRPCFLPFTYPEEESVFAAYPPQDLKNAVQASGSRSGATPSARQVHKKRSLPPLPREVTSCRSCGREMEMLVQIFAPLEGSCYDRTLSIYGCAREACQRVRGNAR